VWQKHKKEQHWEQNWEQGTGAVAGAMTLAYLFIHSLRSRNSCVFVCNFLFERILQNLKADTKATTAAVACPQTLKHRSTDSTHSHPSPTPKNI